MARRLQPGLVRHSIVVLRFQGCKSQTLPSELGDPIRGRFSIRADLKDHFVGTNGPGAWLEMMGVVRRQKVEFTTSVRSELVGHPESARWKVHRRGGAEDLNRSARLFLLTGANPVLEQVMDIHVEGSPGRLRARRLCRVRCRDYRLCGQT